MKRRMSVVAIMALSLWLATPRADAGKIIRFTAVPLTVTVEGVPGETTSPFNIRSDGGGAYVNGLEGVEASFESDGNFVVRSFGARALYFEYDEPLAGALSGVDGVPDDPAMGFPPEEADSSLGLLASGASLPTLRLGSEALQNMPYPDGPTAGSNQRCLRISFSYPGAERGASYRNTFQRTTAQGLADAAADGTAWGVITRLDADTWTIEPGAGDCPSVPAIEGAPGAARLMHVATVKNRSTLTNHGRFNLPFKITLTRQ